MANIALARKAYSGLEAAAMRAYREPQDYQSYFDLLAEDAVLEFGVPDGTPLSQPFRGKQAIIEFYTEQFGELFDAIRLTEPLEFIETGDRVVILGRESYKIRRTGVVATNKAFAVALDFKEGLISRDTHILEMNEFVDSCRIRDSHLVEMASNSTRRNGEAQ